MTRRSDDLSDLVLGAAVTAVVFATALCALLFVAVRDRGDHGDRAVAAGTDHRAAGPSRTVSATPDTSPVARATSARPSPTPTQRRTPDGPGTTAADGTVTYVVRRGDTLSAIAAWFRLHGYQRLYERNADVIGADPDLIVPGERVTVSPAGATMTPAG